jgi:hypothetical protein
MKETIEEQREQIAIEEIAINWWQNQQTIQQQGLCRMYFPNSNYLSLNKNEMFFIFDKENKQIAKKNRTMKQTAVEWLVQQIKDSKFLEAFEEEINQANELFEKQIINAYKEGVDGTKLAEQYYNETFKVKI